MATKKASTKATEETKAVKKTVTRRKRTKAVEEPVVMESVVEVTSKAPAVEETTQDSSVQQQGPVIARPTYFTGSIDELNAAIQQNQAGFDNGLQNPALGIQQQQPVQTTIQFPVIPVMETKVVNPAAMGSEQKAALEQQIQQSQQPSIEKKEENKMTKQENLSMINENKINQQVKEEEVVVNALLAEKIADAVAKDNKNDRLVDAFTEGVITGAACGVGVVTGAYLADKAILAFEDWKNNKDKAEETVSLISNLL